MDGGSIKPIAKPENPGAEASSAEIRASINPIGCGKKGGNEKLWGFIKPIAEPKKPRDRSQQCRD